MKKKLYIFPFEVFTRGFERKTQGSFLALSFREKESKVS